MEEYSAIKKTKITVEGTQRFFQTTELLASYLKLEQRKIIVYSLSTRKNTLTNLLAASGAAYCYHNLGIRTKTEEQMVSKVTSIEAFETTQKREIYSEIKNLIGNSIKHEISLSLLELDYEKQIITAMLEDPSIKKERFIQNLIDQLEEHLIKSLNQFPTVHWLDHVGELTGYTPIVKSIIIEESSKLKAIGLDLEIDLVQERKHDKYMELSSFNMLYQKMQKDFEFSSAMNLRLETFPIKKILNRIIAYRLNLYPISKIGLKFFLEATHHKRWIYNKLLEADENPSDYGQLETDIKGKIVTDLMKIAKFGPNELVYYLQNLLGLNFDEVFPVLIRFGISNVPLFCDILDLDLESFKSDTKLHRLSKMIFKRIDSKKGILFIVQQSLNQLKIKSLSKSEKSVEQILHHQDEQDLIILKKACKSANVDFDRLNLVFQQKQIINFYFSKKYPLNGPISCYSLIFDITEILENLSKTIFFTFFRKISQQIARVLESYVKLNEDKGLYLLGLKRILDSSNQEEWVKIKIEELIIQRLMKRQEELAMIFNAENNAFLVNSFVYARLFDCNLISADNILQNDPSILYGDDVELCLPKDMISPVSYVIAYDILHRLKEDRELRIIEIELFTETDEETISNNIITIAEHQQKNTLNFIEKKITSTLISVSAVSNNPTHLYWNKKDEQTVIDNIIIHSKLESQKICLHCGFDTTTTPCPEHPDNSKLANLVDLFVQYYSFALNCMKQQWSKIKIPIHDALYTQIHLWVHNIMNQRLSREVTPSDYDEIIDGERREVAREIAKAIGKKLDKTIYKKFKANLKNIKK
jgi:hypothetical protein